MSAVEVMAEIEHAFKAWQQREVGYWAQLTDVDARLSHKQLMLLLHANLTLQHAYSSLKLASNTQLASARALVRPALEAYGRCIYIADVAPDGWSEEAVSVLYEMQALADAGDVKGALSLEMKIYLPYGKKLRNVIDGKAPQFDELFVSAYDEFNGPLNSYTHGGVLQTGRLFNIGGIGEPALAMEHCRHVLSMISLAVNQLVYISIKFNRDDISNIARKSYIELFESIMPKT